MASMPALRWATQSHESPNIEGFNDMFNAAAGAMKAIGLTKVKRNPDDVSGVSPDTLTAITFMRSRSISRTCSEAIRREQRAITDESITSRIGGW